MIVPNPDYRPNPQRAIFVQGEINRQLVQRLSPEIIRLQGESRDPITVYIDSEGGTISYAEALQKLLTVSDQDGSGPCRIITVATGLAASAAADLLCSGGYALAHEGATILFHGVRRSGEQITVTVASNIAESLRRTNERYAITLADKAIRRFGFRYAWMYSDFNGYRTRVGKDLRDVECFTGLLLERLSRNGLRAVERAQERNKRYGTLTGHVARAARKSKAFQNANRPAESEAVIIKAIIDFEKSQNKNKDWTFIDGGLRQTANDFLLVREYLDIYDSDHLRRLCDNWGLYFLVPEDRKEVEAMPQEQARTDKLHEKVKPLLRPLWLFFIALCYSLQDGDHELTATDAFWLGLIDEVIGGPSDLFPFRLVVENPPNPESSASASADTPTPEAASTNI